ncbi:MAG TPA: aldose 1-epimerase family protein [Stackebrandtia sp.]|jgi:aldose 1-epimerase|uniref:aldose 1-epimerase family protein n=1 Tax=Stackebrandtia sp. TaxID=2023065 RepID=UPI002D6D2FBA|nr:aldose 1-epimerase family protein [Stackebrandtia sp.]HZE42110.1 aldose 1-epimerase family protein [Stackebrandtia sp.]
MSLSGEQWTISYAGRDAVIASVGGGLRGFTVDGKSYIDSYGDDEIAPGWAGHTLAPWPGRLADGQYHFDGRDYQLALNEPSTRTALHGLVGWVRWRGVDVSDSSVTVECALPAQPGFPYPLVLRTRWSVGPYGLRAVHTVSNVGTHACPFGLGVHPYLTVPGSPMSEWKLRVPAKTQLVVDDRKLPTGDTTATFTEATAIGDTVLDTTFGDLQRDDDRNARVELASADDTEAVTFWFDESFGWLHLYTGDTLDGERRRRCLAIEPMSCPPNALSSGTDVVTLSPGDLWSGTWGITPRRAR